MGRRWRWRRRYEEENDVDKDGKDVTMGKRRETIVVSRTYLSNLIYQFEQGPTVFLLAHVGSICNENMGK